MLPQELIGSPIIQSPQVVPSEVDVGCFAVVEFDGVHEVVFGVVCGFSEVVEFDVGDGPGLAV